MYVFGSGQWEQGECLMCICVWVAVGSGVGLDHGLEGCGGVMSV